MTDKLPKNVRDLRGKTFGTLRPLSFAGLSAHGKATFLCLCDPTLGGCNKQRVVAASVLGQMAKKKTRTCTCAYSEGKLNKTTLTGQTIGQLRIGEHTAEGYRCMCPNGHTSIRSHAYLNQKSKLKENAGRWCTECRKQKADSSTGTVIVVDEAFVKEFKRTVYAGLLSVLDYDDEVADDLAQEVFTKINGMKLNLQYGDKSIGNFLKRMARNAAISWKKKTQSDSYQDTIVIDAAPELRERRYSEFIARLKDESYETGYDFDSRLSIMSRVWQEWSEESPEEAEWLRTHHSNPSEKSKQAYRKAGELAAMLRSRYQAALESADLRRTV